MCMITHLMSCVVVKSVELLIEYELMTAKVLRVQLLRKLNMKAFGSLTAGKFQLEP